MKKGIIRLGNILAEGMGMSAHEDVKAAKKQLVACIESTPELLGGRSLGLAPKVREGSDSQYYLELTTESTDLVTELRAIVAELGIEVEVDILLSGKVTAQLNS